MRLSPVMLRITQVAILASAIATAIAAQTTRATGSISGQLLLRNGKPAADERVIALAVDRDATLLAPAKTDGQGRFRLEDLPPGNYYVAAGSLDHLTYFPGVSNERQATAVTVAKGGTAQDIVFRFLTVRVSGRAFGDAQGRELFLVQGPGAPTTTITRDGSFLFGAVLPGTYQLTTRDTSQSGAQVGSRGGAPVGSRGGSGQQPTMGVVAAPVVVGDDDITDLQVSVGRVMPVEVTVTVEGGEKPPPFLLLRFEDARAKQVPAPFVEATATTATESFEVSLPDIQYRLVLPQLPPGLFVKSATLVYPSGGTTSVLQREFVAHQAARLAIVLARR